MSKEEAISIGIIIALLAFMAGRLYEQHQVIDSIIG